LIAPVALVGFDEMGREALARVEGDDRDLALVDDGEDTAAGPDWAAAAVTDSCAETILRTVTRCFDMQRTVTHVPTHE
jgi:hypothetical protein